MHFYYSDIYQIPLPNGHRFPGHKYQLLRQYLLEKNILNKSQLHPSPFANIEDIKRAHCHHYVEAYTNGHLSEVDMKPIGLPWSEQLVDRSLATMGGAIEAAKTCLQTGLSGQLAGGTHHAHYDYGSGYCIFNDLAITALKALEEKWVRRIAIIDLDVHQGDGNASLLSKNPNCFVFSMHAKNNFPFEKYAANLDIELPDNTTDQVYLQRLYGALPKVFAFEPELVLYQAGVDPLIHDKLGRLDLSFEGLIERDHMILESCYTKNIPISIAIGGGYSDPIDHTINAYANTYKVAKEIYRF